MTNRISKSWQKMSLHRRINLVHLNKQLWRARIYSWMEIRVPWETETGTIRSREVLYRRHRRRMVPVGTQIQSRFRSLRSSQLGQPSPFKITISSTISAKVRHPHRGTKKSSAPTHPSNSSSLSILVVVLLAMVGKRSQRSTSGPTVGLLISVIRTMGRHSGQVIITKALRLTLSVGETRPL